MQPKCHVHPQISIRILGSWVNPCFFRNHLSPWLHHLPHGEINQCDAEKKTIVHGEMPWFLGKTTLVFFLKSPRFFYFFWFLPHQVRGKLAKHRTQMTNLPSKLGYHSSIRPWSNPAFHAEISPNGGQNSNARMVPLNRWYSWMFLPPVHGKFIGNLTHPQKKSLIWDS